MMIIIIFQVLGLCASIYLITVFAEEDDSCKYQLVNLIFRYPEK